PDSGSISAEAADEWSNMHVANIDEMRSIGILIGAISVRFVSTQTWTWDVTLSLLESPQLVRLTAWVEELTRLDCMGP
ncbi:hypothetical protein THAOC_09510, partial [Thalassiosira oceanica]